MRREAMRSGPVFGLDVVHQHLSEIRLVVLEFVALQRMVFIVNEQGHVLNVRSHLLRRQRRSVPVQILDVYDDAVTKQSVDLVLIPRRVAHFLAVGSLYFDAVLPNMLFGFRR